MWPRGAPTAAVHGQLGWFDVRYSRLLSTFVFHPKQTRSWDVARRHCIPRFVGSLSGSRRGVGCGASQSVIRRLLRHARVFSASHANASRLCPMAAALQFVPSGVWSARVSCSCSLLPAVAVTLPAMGAVRVIEAIPSDLAFVVLVMQTLLRMLHCAPCFAGTVAFSRPTKAIAQFVDVIYLRNHHPCPRDCEQCVLAMPRRSSGGGRRTPRPPLLQ